MRKRVISLLLCLVLLVSLVAPVVYAQQPSAAVTADDLIIGENVVLDDVQVDGTSFTQTEQTDDDLMIGEDVTLDDVQVEDTSFTQSEQTDDDQPTGQASATLDGATVNAYGIPEGGTVTVENTVFSGAEQALISELEITDAQELFSWEISVQDAAGDDWQPEGTVELELSLPDVKLHKYTKVYVLHEADDGTQTYIAARVTEEGTLSFVTDGFSSFAGFTVDFDYEGTTFSMDGLDSILLSVLMDQLKAPLYVKDVASVSFSDPSLLSVEEQVDGDWLLTSLQAFRTTEKLSLTMVDGTVYGITVTDESFARLYFKNGMFSGRSGQTGDTNGSSSWYLDADGNVSSNNEYSSTQVLEVCGGTHEIVLQAIKDETYGETVTVKLPGIILTDGAELTVRFGADFRDYGGDIKTVEFVNQKDSHVFCVYNGKLTIADTSNFTDARILLNGNGQKAAIIGMYDDATYLKTESVDFTNSTQGAILVGSGYDATRANLDIIDCTFDDTVTNAGGNGGAIHVAQKRMNSTAYSHIGVLNITDCEFNGNDAASGGAIALRGKVYVANITGSIFDDCDVTGTYATGGSIYIDGSCGMVNIDGCEFKNGSSTRWGGAIDVTSSDQSSAGQSNSYSRINTLTIKNSDFTDLTANSYYGGAVSIRCQLYRLSVLSCDFLRCNVGGNGSGTICIDSVTVPSTAGWTNEMSGYGEETREVNDDTYQHPGASNRVTTVQKIEIKGAGDNNRDCTFTDCEADNQGGAIFFRQNCAVLQDVTIEFVTIDGCKARYEGSAIGIHDCYIAKVNLKNSTIQNCDFLKDTNGEYGSDIRGGGTIRTIGLSTCDLYMYNCLVQNNFSYGNGGGLYWAANGVHRLEDGEECKAVVENCTFYQNKAGKDETYFGLGGGICVEAVIDIVQCEIMENEGNVGGGIMQKIYSNADRVVTGREKTILKLDPQTKVHDNIARTGGGIALSCGSSLSIPDGQTVAYTMQFDLNGAWVYNNKATGDGGGISFIADKYPDSPLEQAEVDNIIKVVNIDDGRVFSNEAGYNGNSGNGGGVYMDSSENAMLTISNGYLYDNAANHGNGGAVYMTGHNAVCTITGGTIGGEYAEDEDQMPISGPNYAHPIATTTDGTTTYTGGNGGGIAIYGGARIEMTGGTISHNESYVGGGIAVRDESVMISDKDSSGNSALISYNKATVAGGGIAVHDESAMEMNAGTISNNEAVYGGGISIMDSTGRTYTVTDRATNTTQEVAIEYGMVFQGSGVIRDNVAVNLVTSADANNSANGGGICISSASTMYIDGGTITGNKAVERVGTENAFTEVYNGGEIGGGIAVCQSSALLVTAGKVDGNYAYNGGGIAITGKSNVEMELASGTTTGGSVSNNTAANNGGGIWLNDNPDKNATNTNRIVITGGVIGDNKATNWGGGVLLGSYAYFELNEGKITNNASKFGAGICAKEVTGAACHANIFISGGEISGNTAQESGGGLYGYYYVDFTISGGDILNNHAVNGSGGGLYSEWYGALKITSGTIDGNDARNNGGGLYLLAVSTEIYGGTVSNNAAENGAGIYTRHNWSFNMYGGTIIDNVASLAGGGIYAGRYGSNSAIVTVSKYTDPKTNKTTYPEINHNTAAIGGGVYLTGGADLTVDGGKVIFNEAKGFCEKTTGRGLNGDLRGVGGGIFVADGYDATNPSTFTLVGGAGTQMAIYGNLADTGADDVFSNGNNTKLTVPLVKNMNLADYEFKPEGWFEDYMVNDTGYEYGLAQGDEDHVYRYRGSAKWVEIPETYVTGDGLAADTTEVYVNKANAYVCMTLGVPAAVDDTVVVDFGLPVKIDIFANDMFIGVSEYQANDGSFLSYVNVSNTTAGYKSSESATFTTAKDANFDKTELAMGTNMLKHGTAALERIDGQVLYQLDVSDMIMDSEETFYYVVKHASQVAGEQKDYYYYAAVTVIPATSIYFEDNFVAYHEGEWKTVPENATSVGSQQQDRPGMSAILEGLDADSIYGYDENYAKTADYSGGSARMVEVTDTTSARASFTFTGTGFDIVSLCSNKSAAVLVNVFKGKITDINDSLYATDAYVISYYVDTYYGYKYDEETEKWVVDPDADDTFYQVPVIKSDLTNVLWVGDDPDTPEYDPVYKNFGYGTYTVELIVGTSWISGSPNNKSAEFYLDAIRIYNPAGDGVGEIVDANGNSVLDENGNKTYDTTIQDAYVADGEAWPVYAELRDIFLTQKDLGVTDTTGVIFIDGKDDPTIGEYRNMGPNNEVYLSGVTTDENGKQSFQSIAFKLNASSYVNSAGANSNFDTTLVKAVHIGIRSLTGAGKVEIRMGNTLKTVELGTTDLYYDISDGINQVVTIQNVGNTPISISNVKITHTTNPVAKGSGNFSDGSGEEGINAQSLFTMSSEDANIALDILTPKDLVDPVVTPKRPALSFNGMVCYNVFFSAADLGDLTAADLGLAVFNTEDTEGTVETADEVHLGATEIDGLYMVATDGVHAKYLGDTKYFKAFAKKADGTYVYSRMVSYSAVDYAKNALANSSDVKLKQLVVAMLNYGTEAQKFFGYKTDELMNKDLTADQQALLAGFGASMLNPVGKVDATKVGSFASTGGFTRRSPAISFKGAFEINYFFTPANPVDGNMTLYFWNEDTYNSVTQLTADNADKVVTMTCDNGTYSAASNEIAAKYLDKTVYVAAVYESNGQTYCSGVLPYSIAAYCQKPPAGVQDLATAAAIYGCTAKQYFGA